MSVFTSPRARLGSKPRDSAQFWGCNPFGRMHWLPSDLGRRPALGKQKSHRLEPFAVPLSLLFSPARVFFFGRSPGAGEGVLQDAPLYSADLCSAGGHSAAEGSAL